MSDCTISSLRFKYFGVYVNVVIANILVCKISFYDLIGSNKTDIKSMSKTTILHTNSRN